MPFDTTPEGIARLIINRIMDEHPCDCILYRGKRLSFNREITAHATWLRSQLEVAATEALKAIDQ